MTKEQRIEIAVKTARHFAKLADGHMVGASRLRWTGNETASLDQLSYARKATLRGALWAVQAIATATGA